CSQVLATSEAHPWRGLFERLARTGSDHSSLFAPTVGAFLSPSRFPLVVLERPVSSPPLSESVDLGRQAQFHH
ncbi:hypothetical protein TUN199_06292, partial [Pyrenophora tritici-repentis]